MNSNSKNKPISHKEEISKHPDPKIDQDFKGYPHGSAKDEIIKPETSEEKEFADIDNKDGEKRNDSAGRNEEIDEQDSDGSANAFDDK